MEDINSKQLFYFCDEEREEEREAGREKEYISFCFSSKRKKFSL